LTVPRKYIKIGPELSTRRVVRRSMKNIYLLKDLAKISGYSTYTLKFYLKLGLLREVGRSPVTNFRYFDDSCHERLKRIRELQKKKLSLKEIDQYLREKNKN